LVFAIASAAMLLLGVRPWRRIPDWVWPVAGALLLLALGHEDAREALAAIARQWNVLLFILGLMGLAAAAEESGAFAWMTDVLLERAGGSRRRLFVLLFLAGAALTLLLSNDATALVFTPLVYRAVAKRGGDAMPYLFACTFVANTASFGLPFSNPANVLILPHAQLADYVRYLGAPELLAIALNLGIFLLSFRPQLRGRYDYLPAGPPRASVLRGSLAMLAVVLAYLVALALRWPLGPVAALGAALTLAAARVAPQRAARHIGWGTFLLLAGLFALLDAVSRAGFTHWAVAAVGDASRHGFLALVAAASAGAALLSNLLNNLPVAVASSYVVAHSSARDLAFPFIAGVDLGPNLTTTGSLATILWLAFLRERGVRVSSVQYFKLGAMVVPATLAVTALWLWLVR
jgi:arsenical pump membrane protein